MTDKILVVDDEPDALNLFARAIERNTPYKAKTCESGEFALALLQEDDIALILADYRMPGMDGLELLRKVREINPDQLFIMITGYGTIEIAVEAMKIGAFDFITKPIVIDQVLFSIQRAVIWRILKNENGDFRNGDSMLLSYQNARHQILKEFNQFYLGTILKKNNGNITRAAHDLAMKRQTLQYLLKKYGVCFMRPDGSNSLKT